MSRELKRVPLDFEWPLNKVWQGYQNPHYASCHDCEVCSGTGQSKHARQLQDVWYGLAPFHPGDRGSAPFLPTHPAIRALAERNVLRLPGGFFSDEVATQHEAKRLAVRINSQWCHHLNASDVAALLASDRLKDLTHTFTAELGWQPKMPSYVPTPEQVNVWSLSGLGHDSMNEMLVVHAECTRLGIPFKCEHCQGSGTLWDSLEAEQHAIAWERIDPPNGEGYQIWAGNSPISSVFATPDELARYMTGKPFGADKGSGYESWLAFINGHGWAPSMVKDGRGIRVGPDAIA